MTKLGLKFYNITNALALKLSRHMFLFWLLSFTWGSICTILGLLLTVILLISGHKPHKYQTTWYFNVGTSWGGLEMGTMFIKDKNSLNLEAHEYGHTFQNAIYGPFYVFIAISSAIRYWYREYLFRYNLSKYQELCDYDSIWFEGSATVIGDLITIERKQKYEKK